MAKKVSQPNPNNRYKLLINEPPLQVLPTLAVSIGLSEALLLQQLHYLMTAYEGKTIEDVKWIRMSDLQWQEQFPFWSRNTIRRNLDNLEFKHKLIRVGNFNERNGDKTQWYSIDYDQLDHLPAKKPRQKRTDYENFGEWGKEQKTLSKNRTGDSLSKNRTNPLSNNRTSSCPKIGQPLPEILSEIPESETLFANAAKAGSCGDPIAEDLGAPIQSKALAAFQEKQAVQHLTQPDNAIPESVQAFQEALQPSEPAAIKEGIENPLQNAAKVSPLPALPAPYEWYTTAGDNDLVHIAKPTQSGKRITLLCGSASYAVPVGGKNPHGNRQPCQQCQQELANLTALAAKAKAPKVQKPPDPVFRWACEYLGVNPDVAWKSPKHEAFILKGYIAQEEKGRLKITTPLTDEQLAACATALSGFIPWYEQVCKDCSRPTWRRFQTWIGKWYLAGRPGANSTPISEWVNVEVHTDRGWVERAVHQSELPTLEWRKPTWIHD